MTARFGSIDLGIRASPLSDFSERIEPFAVLLGGGPELKRRLALIAREYVDGRRWLKSKSSRVEARRALEALGRPCKTLLTILQALDEAELTLIGSMLRTCDSLADQDVSASALGRDLQDLAEEPLSAGIAAGTEKRPGLAVRLTLLGERLEALPMAAEWELYVGQENSALFDHEWPVQAAMARLLERIAIGARTAAGRVTRRGPLSNTHLMRTVQALAELWVQTGRKPTHSDTVRGSHTGLPQSDFGRFVAEFVATIEPNAHRRGVNDVLEHVAWPSRNPDRRVRLS